jgi:hypothetical protein
VALSARLRLTAEPPALVRIDGKSVGRTPLLGLELREGAHRVAFTSAVLGETLHADVRLPERGERRVHADFTSATPQVHVR